MRRQIIECDRCGSEIRNPAGVTKLSTDAPITTMAGHPLKNIDLCGDCGDGFCEFMKNRPVRAAGPLRCNL